MTMGSPGRRKLFGISLVLALAVTTVLSASAFAVAYFIERVELRGAATENFAATELDTVLTGTLNNERLIITCQNSPLTLTLEKLGESRGRVVFETEAGRGRSCTPFTITRANELERLANCTVRTPYTWPIKGQLLAGVVEDEQELKIETPFNVELEGARCELPAGRVISGVAYRVEGSELCSIVAAAAELESHPIACTACLSRVRFNGAPATLAIENFRAVLARRERWSAR